MKAFAKNIEALVLAFILVLSFARFNQAYAAVCDAVYQANMNPNDSQDISITLPNPTNLATNKIALCSSADGIFPDIDANDPVGMYCYRISMCNTGVGGAGGCASFPSGSWFYPQTQSITNGGTTLSLPGFKYDKSYTFKIERNDLLNGSSGPLGSSRVSACSSEWKVNVQTVAPSCNTGTFTLAGPNGTTLNPLTLNFDGTKTHDFFRGVYQLQVQPAGGGSGTKRNLQSLGSAGDGLAWGSGPSQSGSVALGTLTPGNWEIVITGSTEGQNYCNLPFSITTDGVGSQPVGGTEATTVTFKLCSQAAGGPDYNECLQCVSSGNIDDPNQTGQKLWTAIGCVSLTKEGIVTSLLRVGIGISGGFVLLSILYGAFLLTTSSGDPKRVQEGQEMITSAIMGLMFVIFSVIILKFIGVTILRIPGFGA